MQRRRGKRRRKKSHPQTALPGAPLHKAVPWLLTDLLPLHCVIVSKDVSLLQARPYHVLLSMVVGGIALCSPLTHVVAAGLWSPLYAGDSREPISGSAGKDQGTQQQAPPSFFVRSLPKQRTGAISLCTCPQSQNFFCFYPGLCSSVRKKTQHFYPYNLCAVQGRAMSALQV